MKLKNLFAYAVVSAMAFIACEKEGDLGTPSITLGTAEVTLPQAGGDTTITVTATRDWTVNVDESAEWLVLNPMQGKASANAQEVTVSALSNDGYDREASVAFTIGMQTKYLTVKQAGTKGSADALVLYSNDFDKEPAVEVEGKGWPYLDNSEVWKNAEGSGAANVTYASSGVTVRNNANSDSKYSDYAGSGVNNLFFGKTPYFAVKGIALGEAVNLELTFGTEKYSKDNGSVFTNSEFHIWLSNDGDKWVELTDYTYAGGTVEGRWNIATANFTVPAGTANLSICMAIDVASSYRIDDMRLVATDKEGTAVDFSKAVEKDFTAGSGSSTGGSTGGDTPAEAPTTLVEATIAEFLAASESTDTWYKLTGEIISIESGNKYGNFTIKDATGEVYIYGMTSKWVGSNDQSFESLGLKVGDTVTLGTLRGSYKDTPQGGGKNVPAYYISHVAGEGGEEGDAGSDSGSEGEEGGNSDVAEEFTSGTYSYVFEKGVISKTGDFVLNKLAWNLSVEWSADSYFGFDGSSGRGIQIGSSNSPAKKVILKTEGITGTIKSVKVNTSGAKETDAEFEVYVGGESYNEKVSLTKTSTDYTFTGSATGKLELIWTLTKKALYVKSIEVVVE